jgi:hypothetical protein
LPGAGGGKKFTPYAARPAEPQELSAEEFR